MDPFFVARALKYYKRREVQEAIVRHAKDREVSPRYGEGFGKRPDVLENPRDVLEFAKRKATSFHCSEERWSNPLRIVTGMPRKEADDLRVGWDLVLDVDAKDWEISRLTAWLFVLALREHGVSCSVKFSGNKGWHVGVPFESFPETVFDGKRDVPMKDLFPDMPRALARYLVEYIGDTTNGLITIEDDDHILFGGKVKGSLSRIAEKAGKQRKEILEQYCPACRKPVDRESEKYGLMCGSCGTRSQRKYAPEEKAVADDTDRVCQKCGHVMDFYLASRGKGCPHSPAGYQRRFRITEVVEFDTVLLASRHLYRMPYSLHEKSGLVSLPIDPEGILEFRKEEAAPDTVAFDRDFLAAGAPGEAAALVAKAWDSREEERPRAQAEFDVPDEMVPEEAFPPCMRLILQGMEDGKKRAMFALVNFLQTAGWPPEMIDARVHEWNAKNPEPLREVNVKGHLRQHLGKKLKILPPNCMAFYRELGVCKPDDLCRTIRNPAQYAVKKGKMKKRKA